MVGVLGGVLDLLDLQAWPVRDLCSLDFRKVCGGSDWHCGTRFSSMVLFLVIWTEGGGSCRTNGPMLLKVLVSHLHKAGIGSASKSWPSWYRNRGHHGDPHVQEQCCLVDLSWDKYRYICPPMFLFVSHCYSLKPMVLCNLLARFCEFESASE